MAIKYPNASEVGNSGIGNTPYVVDSSNIDNYPLTKIVAVPELSYCAVVILVILATTVVLVSLKRKVNTS
jgi:hypothetical protein